jgi:hypothetical protein
MSLIYDFFKAKMLTGPSLTAKISFLQFAEILIVQQMQENASSRTAQTRNIRGEN